MKSLDYLKTLNYKLQLEKLVIGVEEPIFIKGVGQILAKVDSGNSAYNVIHGEDFYRQGDIIIFTTYDENNKPHKISKKIQDTIVINIGGGKSEERPLVLFDVKFANDEFVNVPFTVGNRKDNKNKVLLGKDFITNKLNALIDASDENIASKNIQVDIPLTEVYDNNKADNPIANQGSNHTINTSDDSNPSGSASQLKKFWQGVKGTTKGIYNMYDTLGNSHGGRLATLMGNLKQNWDKMVNEINDYQKDDKYLIFKQLNLNFMDSGDPIKPFINNPQVIKILDYIGNDYTKKNQSDIAPEELKNQDTNNNTNTVSEETKVPTANQQSNNNNNLVNNKKIFNKIKDMVANELKPILYLVIYDGDNLEKTKEVLASKYPNYKGPLGKMMDNIKESFYSSNTEEFAKKIIEDLAENNILATFALVKGKKSERKVTFLGTSYKKTNLTSFLLEEVKNYTKELLYNVQVNDNAKIREGTFLSNPIFGFALYQQEQKDNNSNKAALLPDEAISEWIKNGNHNGYNVKAAFQKYIGDNITSFKSNKNNIRDYLKDNSTVDEFNRLVKLDLDIIRAKFKEAKTPESTRIERTNEFENNIKTISDQLTNNVESFISKETRPNLVDEYITDIYREAIKTLKEKYNEFIKKYELNNSGQITNNPNLGIDINTLLDEKRNAFNRNLELKKVEIENWLNSLDDQTLKQQEKINLNYDIEAIRSPLKQIKSIIKKIEPTNIKNFVEEKYTEAENSINDLYDTYQQKYGKSEISNDDTDNKSSTEDEDVIKQFISNKLNLGERASSAITISSITNSNNKKLYLIILGNKVVTIFNPVDSSFNIDDRYINAANNKFKDTLDKMPKGPFKEDALEQIEKYIKDSINILNSNNQEADQQAKKENITNLKKEIIEKYKQSKPKIDPSKVKLKIVKLKPTSSPVVTIEKKTNNDILKIYDIKTNNFLPTKQYRITRNAIIRKRNKRVDESFIPYSKFVYKCLYS